MSSSKHQCSWDMLVFRGVLAWCFMFWCKVKGAEIFAGTGAGVGSSFGVAGRAELAARASANWASWMRQSRNRAACWSNCHSYILFISRDFRVGPKSLCFSLGSRSWSLEVRDGSQANPWVPKTPKNHGIPWKRGLMIKDGHPWSSQTSWTTQFHTCN